jgi:hypothetical protein
MSAVAVNLGGAVVNVSRTYECTRESHDSGKEFKIGLYRLIDYVINQ